MPADTLYAHPRHRRPLGSGGHISELHGLRGLALALVVVFHLFGNGRVSGGVDVFLVVSGFLLTLTLVRRADGPGIRLGEQYSRIATRLVPPALITLAGVAFLTVMLFPQARWLEITREIIASALYVENWELINSQLEYGAAGPAASPLQHFWSLSVQGQFFALWPAVVVLAAFAVHRLRVTLPQVLGGLLAVATAASFVHAARLNVVQPDVAYFSSFSRFWEIGAGALLALAMPHLRLGDRLRAALGWIGLALVLSCGFLVDGAQHFPGPWALWPVAGALLVLAGSGAASRWGPRDALQVRPLRFVADISYPLYLWHWPLLVFYLHARGYDAVGWRGAAVLLALSLGFAWLTQLLVSGPTQRHSTRMGVRRTLVTAVASLALVVASGTGVVATIERQQEAALQQAAKESPDHPGARALVEDVAYSDSVPVRPAPDVAGKDYFPSAGEGCIQRRGDGEGHDEVLACHSHVPDQEARHVVIAGGSHSYQWEPALRSIAEQHDWRLTIYGKSACRMEVSTDDSDCARWGRHALDRLIEDSPDAVFVTGTRTPDERVDEEMVNEEQVLAWRELAAAGIPVLAIRDNPRFGHDVPECVAEHGTASEKCGISRAEALAASSPTEAVADMPPTVHHLDLTDSMCTEMFCSAVIGNIIVYRDDDHFTATYVRTMTPALRDAIRSAMPGLL